MYTQSSVYTTIYMSYLQVYLVKFLQFRPAERLAQDGAKGIEVWNSKS